MMHELLPLFAVCAIGCLIIRLWFHAMAYFGVIEYDDRNPKA